MKVYLITYDDHGRSGFKFLPKMTLDKDAAIRVAERDGEDTEIHIYEYELENTFEGKVSEIKFTPHHNFLKDIKL